MSRNWKRDGLLIFLLTAVLIWPLFRLKYMDNWGSIESIFISDARMLKDRGFLPQWQPYWYCGTRWDYIYPPALRYMTAGLAALLNATAAKAYHIYTGFMYCVAIAGVYWLVRTGTGKRGVAWLVAAASAILSPCFLFVERVRLDSAAAFFPPQRLNVLVRYGEGPHMSAYALIPIALACLWRGLRPGESRWLAGAALAMAGVVSNNFYGATALAMFAPILLWAVWITTGDWRVWLRGALSAILAFGLCAWWLTPSYLRLTLYNMRFVSSEGNAWSKWVALAAVVGFTAISLWWAYRREERAWPVFVWGSLLFFTLNVLGNEYFGFRVIGEPGRLIPELELAMFLAVALSLAWAWNRWARLRTPLAIAVALVFLVGGRPYLTHAWRQFPRSSVAAEDRIEYKTAQWLHENMRGSRVLLAGTNRFWANAWFNVSQVGGGSDQGVSNPVLMDAQFAMMNAAPPVAVDWLKATGADAVVVTDRRSDEIYHDWQNPTMFEGLLPLAFDDNKGTRIYRVPRRSPVRARVVNRAEAAGVLPILGHGDPDNLGKYLKFVEEGPSIDLTTRWVDEEHIEVRPAQPLDLAPGQMVLVQETFDPAWTAEHNGTQVEVSKDPMGFMLVAAGSFDLRFETPLENQVGRGVGIASFIGMAVLWFRRRQ